MRSPLSSQRHNLSKFYSSVRTPNADRRVTSILALPLVARVMPPKRTVILRQDSPSFADPGFFSVLETTNGHASGLAASRVGGPRSHWPRPCARCLRQTSIRVGAHLCPCGQQAEAPQSVFAHWRSAEAWYRDDPSVPRLPLGKPVYIFGRPDQSSTRRYRRFPCSLYCPPVAVC